MKTESPTPATVLVEIAADGFITVYGDQHVQVRIINRPIASNAENGCRLDELIGWILPWRYREIYWPGNVRTYGHIQRMTLAGVQHRVAQQEIVESIGALNGQHQTRKQAKVLRAITA